MFIIVSARPNAIGATRFLARARRWAYDVTRAAATKLIVDLGHYAGCWIRAQVLGLAG